MALVIIPWSLTHYARCAAPTDALAGSLAQGTGCAVNSVAILVVSPQHPSANL